MNKFTFQPTSTSLYTMLPIILQPIPKGKVFIPVLHLITPPGSDVVAHVIAQARIAVENGADGLAICPSEPLHKTEILAAVTAVAAEFRDLPIIINFMCTVAEALESVPLFAHLWTDKGVDAQGVYTEAKPEYLVYNCIPAKDGCTVAALCAALAERGVGAAIAKSGIESCLKNKWITKTSSAGVAVEGEIFVRAKENVGKRRVDWFGTWLAGYFHKGSNRDFSSMSDESLSASARAVAALSEIPITSGAGTGVPPVPAELARLRMALSATSVSQLANASGVDIGNVYELLPFIDVFLVATGIEREASDPNVLAFYKECGLPAVDVGYLDANKTRALADAIHSVAPVEGGGEGGGGSSGSGSGSNGSNCSSSGVSSSILAGSEDNVPPGDRE